MRPEQVSFSSHPRPFRVGVFRCGDPECECTAVTFKLKEAAARRASGGRRLAFTIRIDGETWEEIDPPSRAPQVAELVDEFLRDYPPVERAAIQAECREKRRVARRLREYRINPRFIEEGKLISFGEIISEEGSITEGGTSWTYQFEHEGVEYLVEDLYCANPDCRCREAHLAFFRCTVVKEPEEKTVADECFMAEVSLDGSRKVTETYDCSRRSAEAVLAGWWEQYADELDRLEWRYEKVKEIGRRSAPRGREARLRHDLLPDEPAPVERRVGRNDPCPCGSGKKFKKCCGQKIPFSSRRA